MNKRNKENKTIKIFFVFIAVAMSIFAYSAFANDNDVNNLEYQNNDSATKEEIETEAIEAIEQKEIVFTTFPTVEHSTYTIEDFEEEQEPEPELIEPIIENKYFDIPLSHELQDYTYNLCEEYNIPSELVFAMMFAESSFRPNLISKTNDYGLMQINKCNHSWMREEYGIADFLDPEQNILCGVIIISELYEKYNENVHKALMAYNCGESGAKKLWNQGYTSSKYSRKIVGYMEDYK